MSRPTDPQRYAEWVSWRRGLLQDEIDSTRARLDSLEGLLEQEEAEPDSVDLTIIRPNGRRPSPEQLTHAPPSGWERIDLGPYLRGEITTPEPTMLDRADGVCMLYPGRLHWISGEPEGCKSWLAAIAVADAIADGEGAVYVDYERDPATIIERLLALGVETQAIQQRLSYHRPQVPTSPEAVNQLLASVSELRPAIAVIDGVNAAMGMDDRNSNLSSDFYAWWGAFGARLRAAVLGPMVVIDHVIKDKESRGPYAAGTGQKLAAVDVHIGVEVNAPFGIGLTGKVRLVLHKDTPGHLRPKAAGHDHTTLGTLTLASDAETKVVRFVIAPPDGQAGQKFRPTNLMERVSIYLETAADARSKRHLRKAVSGNDDHVETAVDRLYEEGYLTSGSQRNYAVYGTLHPYRQDNDPLLSDSSGANGAKWRLRGAGRQAAGVAPVAPPLYGGATPAPPRGGPDAPPHQRSGANATDDIDLPDDLLDDEDLPEATE